MGDDPDKKTDDEAKKTTSEGQDATSATTEQDEQSDDWWQEAQSRGFKEQQAVWKSYQEAERKISEQGKELNNLKKFELEVGPVIDAIWADDELLGKVRDKLSGNQTDKPIKNSENKKGDKQEEPQYDPEVRAQIRSQILNEFESSKGMDKLDDESRKEIRSMIGREMVKWMPDPRKEIPINRMRDYLEDAFVIAEKKNEKMASLLKSSQRQADEGAFPSTSSGGVDMSGKVSLTADQKKVAQKMGLSEEQYAKGLQKLR